MRKVQPALSTHLEADPPRASPNEAEPAGDPRQPEVPTHADQIFSLVCRQIHALCGRRDPSFDDLVQVAAEQALRALPSFRGGSELTTWTYQICYRTVLRHRRWYSRWLRRFSLDAPNADVQRDEPSAVDELGEHERAARLYAALDQLSAKRRAVVVLKDLEGRDVSNVATIVGAGPATVRSRLRDGRRDLARILALDPYFTDDAPTHGRQHEREEEDT